MNPPIIFSSCLRLLPTHTRPLLSAAMNPPEPAPAERIFAEALLAGRHSPEALRAEFGEIFDKALDLARIPPEDLLSLRGNKVLPAPGVTEYLAGGDPITDEILDAAEIATERHYKLESPFFITSIRDGEGDRRRARYFYLDVET